jgi:hypothetical protein
MTYQPYEAAVTHTVPPTGYGTPYGNPTVTQPGSAGGDSGPFSPPQDNAPSKTKWAMVIGIAAAVVVFAISGVFLLKPGSSPSQAIVTPPHVPANNTSGTNSSATNSSATTSGSTGSSTATQPMDTAAEVNQYLDEVDNQGGDFDYVSDSDLLALGNATCADFEEGASVEGTVDDALNYAENDSDGLDDQDMGVILGAATSTLCPSYGPEVQAWSAQDNDNSD